MKIVKKIFVIVFIFLVTVTQMMYTSYADTSMTKDGLEQGLKKLKAVFDEGNMSFQYTINEDTISVSVDGEMYSTSYDLSNSQRPVFTIIMPITQQMNDDEVADQINSIYSMQAISYALVAATQGIDPIDAVAYYMMSIFNISLSNYSLSDNSSQDYEDAIGYARELYGNKQVIADTDGLNSYVASFELQNASATSVNLVSNFEVDANANFSRLNGYSDNPSEDLYGNTLGFNSNYENYNSYNYDSDDEPSTSRSSVTSRDSTISSTELPKTGINIILLIAVLSVVIISIIFAINNKRFKDIK